MNRPHYGDNLDVLRRHGEDTWERNEDAIAPRLCGRKQSSDAIMPAMTALRRVIARSRTSTSPSRKRRGPSTSVRRPCAG